jgi:hypothetical protein
VYYRQFAETAVRVHHEEPHQRQAAPVGDQTFHHLAQTGLFFLF